jgi:hypothetical protein
MGNQAMLRLLEQRRQHSEVLQRKLVVGQVNDPLEHEADRIADQVMRMPDPQAEPTNAPIKVSRKCASCEEEAVASGLQHNKDSSTERGGEVPPVVRETLIQKLNDSNEEQVATTKGHLEVAAAFVRSSLGRAPDSEVRYAMERHFSLSLAHVRIHSGIEAAATARALGARAFTYGSNIVLGGDVAPKSIRGQITLAHEFAHAAQQRNAGDRSDEQRTTTESEEREAHAAAIRFVSARPSVPLSTRTGAVLAREEPDPCAALEGRFTEAAGKEEAPWPKDRPPPPWITADGMDFIAWRRDQNAKIDQIEKEKELITLCRLKTPSFFPTYNFMTARKEPNLGSFPYGVVFDGQYLLLLRGGKVLVSAEAGSGDPNVRDEHAINKGPLPDGIYMLSPQRRAPAIDKWQSPGVQGAAGIDAGYQVILDKSVQGTWGEQRIRIEIKDSKDRRPGLFIHGGSAGYATSGCIKHHSAAFWAELLKFNASIPLSVQKINRPVVANDPGSE